MKTNIMPECYVDTNLIEYLIGDTVGHQHCCSKVVGTMKRDIEMLKGILI